jgi:hypothetical protein
MPDNYKNPTSIPTSGSYTWVPTPPTTIGGLNFASGFLNLIIDRGSFRNYYVRRKNNETFIKINPYKNSTQGYIYNPIINATRPLSLGFPVILGNGKNLAITNIISNEILEFEFLQLEDRPLSCIQITYDLSVWEGDSNYNFTLNPEPPAVLLYGVTSSGAEELIQTEIFKGLFLTRTRKNFTETNLVSASEAISSDSQTVFRNLKIKIKNEILDRSKFPKYKKIIFKINPSSIKVPTSLVFVVKKIMFFTADRVNFRFQENQKQLPCAALGYSLDINGKFFPSLSLEAIVTTAGNIVSGGLNATAFGLYVWPGVFFVTPTINVKLFNPDFTTGSPGFAHSLDLRIYIYIQPVFGPVESSQTLQSGILFYGTIIGPQVFTQQLIFFGYSISKNTNLATINSAIFKKNSGLVNLEQSEKIIATKSIFSYQAGFENNLKNQFYYEQQGISTSNQFRNIYVDEFGISNPSDTYEGTLPRTELLNASEATSAPPSNLQTKKFSYNTYLFKNEPNLFELFTKSSPCLTFKLNPTDAFSQLSLDSGFLYSAINCFVSEPTEILDTRLAYRIFASPKVNNVSIPDPNSPGTQTFKIINSGKADSSIESEKFDKNWDFSNVLVTGVVSANLQQLETSEIINNTKKGTFNPLPNNAAFDLYCSIYAFSNLSDAFANYDLTNFSSLNLPVITFSIKNDFILQLPLYYRKSKSNGGDLQAQRFPGLKGQYSPETDVFTILTTTYSGISVSSNPYTKTIENVTGVSELFVIAPNTEQTNTSYTISINDFVSKNNYVSRTDYVVLFDSTSNSRINFGDWLLSINASSDKDVSVKFEVDLVDKQTSKLILKIISSKYQKLSSDPSKATITVPFFLPQTEGLVILKLYFKSSTAATVNIEKIILEKNTLEYFSFTPGQVGGSLIGFYEDLPVQPTSYVAGGSQFILKLDSTPTQIFSFNDGLSINGALYSPTWAVNLPENMEVRLDSQEINGSRTGTVIQGAEPYRIFFRTGLSNEIKSVDTKRHDNGLIITVANTQTNISKNAVLQIVSESYYRNTSISNIVKTPLANLNLEELDLSRPTLTRTDNQFVPIGIFGQKIMNEKLNSIFLSMQAPGFYAAQSSEGGTLLPVSNQSAIAVKIQECFFTVAEFRGNKVFALGVTANGSLIMSFSQSDPTANASNFVLLEGDPDNSLTNEDLKPFTPLYIPKGADNSYFFNGPANVSYPGFLFTNENPIIFYVFKKTNNLSSNAKSNREKNKIVYNYAIYARVVDATRPSNAFLVFDFKKYCEINLAFSNGISSSNSTSFNFNDSEFPIINQITVCKNDVYLYGKNFNLAFDAGGKIFILRGSYTQNNCFISGLAIAYGNLNVVTSSSQSKFVNALNILISKSAVCKIKYKAGQGVNSSTFKSYEKNLEDSQKLGFVDYDGINVGVQFYIANEIYEILFDKSYVLEGQFRKIGEVYEG